MYIWRKGRVRYSGLFLNSSLIFDTAESLKALRKLGGWLCTEGGWTSSAIGIIRPHPLTDDQRSSWLNPVYGSAQSCPRVTFLGPDSAKRWPDPTDQKSDPTSDPTRPFLINDDQAKAQITIANADVGQSPSPTKPKYRKLEEKLTKAHEKYASGVIDQRPDPTLPDQWRSGEGTDNNCKRRCWPISLTN